MKGALLRLLWSSGVVFLFGATTLSTTQGNRSEGQYPIEGLACLQRVQISLDEDGMHTIHPSELLAEEYSSYSMFEVMIKLPGRDSVLFCTDVGKTLMVMVRDTTTGNSCWTMVKVEDKLPPKLLCSNDTLPCTIHPDSVNYGMYVSYSDNCDTAVQVQHTRLYQYLGCTHPLFTGYTENIWIVTDQWGNADTCTSTVYFKRPPLVDIRFPSDTTMYCPSANPDEAGVPSYMGRPLGALCDVLYYYVDDTIVYCAGSYEIFRHWTVLQQCNLQRRDSVQRIVVLDTLGPMIQCPDTVVVGTDIDLCGVRYMVGSLAVKDSCSPVDSIQWSVWIDGMPYSVGAVVVLDTGLHAVRYIAVDDCGNSDTCDFVLKVVDDDAPILLCATNDTIGLGNDSIVVVDKSHFDSLVQVYDNCTDSFVVRIRRMEDRCDRPVDTTFSGVNLAFCCNDVGVPVMVVIEVEDSSGNVNSCMINVVVVDTVPPMITMSPPDTTVSCTVDFLDTAVTGGIKYVDNCPTQLVVTVVDSNGVNSCKTGVIKRTFVVCDPQMNCDTAVQYITVVNPYTFDTTDVVWPRDTVIEDCPADSLPSTIGSMVVVRGDSCRSIVVMWMDSVVADTTDACLIIYRTWQVWDTCSAVRTHLDSVQVLTFLNYRPPVLSGPRDTTVYATDCGAYVALDSVRATDCSSNVVITNDYNGGGPDASDTFPIGMTTVRFVAVDNCGNTSTYAVKITVLDTSAPQLICPADTTVLCDFDFTLDSLSNFGDVTVVDNCLDSVWIRVDTIDQRRKCNAGTVTRIWYLRDSFGHRDTCMQTITFVVDTVSPTNVVFPNDTVIEDCPPDSLPSTIGSMVVVYNNRCGTIKVEYQDTDVSDPNDVCLVIDRRWIVTDSCSERSPVTERVQRITILNYRPPLLTVPDDVTVYAPEDSCSKFVRLRSATVTDCSAGVVITNDYNSGGADASDVYPVGTTCVVFTATDGCGQQSTDTTCITVLDTIPPMIRCPQDTTVLCSAVDLQNLSAFGDIVVTENCDSVVVMRDSVVNVDSCGAGYILRRWYVLDSLGQADSCVQTITVVPDTLRLSNIQCPPDTSMVDICDSVGLDSLLNIMPQVDSFGGLCGPIGISFTDQVQTLCQPPVCKRITRVWRIVDSCQYDGSGQGVFECTHVVEVIDTMPPQFGGIPFDTTLFAAPDSCRKYVRLQATLEDCAGVGFVMHDAPYGAPDSLDISGEYPIGVTLVTFVYEDSCCNRDTTIVSIRIVDSVPPMLTCSPYTATLERTERGQVQVQVCPRHFGVVKSDNCVPDSNLVVTMNKNNLGDSCRTYTCDSLMGQQSKTFVIKLYVIDTINNTIDSCTTVLVLNDANGLCGGPLPPVLGGKVLDPFGHAIVGATVLVDEVDSGVVKTDANGYYSFDFIPRPNFTYTVHVRYGRLHRYDGLTVRDLWRLQMHLLDLRPFKRAAQHFAADLNGDRRLSSKDMVQLRDILLGRANTFTHRSQWFFYAADCRPRGLQLPCGALDVSYRDTNETKELNIRGVRLGDVDLSGSSMVLSSDVRASVVEALYRVYRSDEGYQILEVRIPQMRDIQGMRIQWSIPTNWTYDGPVERTDNLARDAWVWLAPVEWKQTHRTMSFLWTSTESGSDEGVFAFAFEETSPPIEVRPFVSGVSEVVTASGELKQLRLQYQSHEPGRFTVYPFQPNPMLDEGYIRLYLPESDVVRLEIFNMTGKRVMTLEQSFGPGEQFLRLKRQYLEAYGSVFFYTLNTRFGTHTDKIMLLD